MRKIEEKPKKLLSKAAYQPRANIEGIILFFAFFLSLVFIHSLSFASHHSERKSPEIDLLSIQSLSALEERVWICQEDEIDDIQGEVTKLIQAQSQSSFAHYLLGQLYIRKFLTNPYEMHLLRQAAELGQQSVDLKPNRDFGYVISAQVLDMMGYTPSAMKLISPTENTRINESWRTIFLRAKFRSAHQGIVESLALFKKALQLNQTQPAVIIPHAVASMEAHLEENQLIDTIKSWEKDFGGEDIQISLAIAYTNQKNYALAQEVYEKILQHNPSSINGKINSGIILYQNLKRVDDSFAILQSVLNDKGHPLNINQTLLVKNHLANIALEKKNYLTARKLHQSILTTADEPGEWILVILESYRSRNLYNEFSELLSIMKEEIPGSGYLYSIHGEILSEKLSNHDAAVESFENAILLDPDQSEFHNGLGLVYYRNKKMNEALVAFTSALRVDPNDATARYNEACVLSILGRGMEALGSLKEAIALDPSLLKNAKADSDFENIRGTVIFRSLVSDSKNLSQISIPLHQHD